MAKDKKDVAVTSKSKPIKQKEGGERIPLLPPGLANHTNTCFFNGTLQSLIATKLLEDTIHFRPVPTFHKPSSVIPIAPTRSPALTNGRGGPYGREWESTMPISDTFLFFMQRAWLVRDSRSRLILSPRDLLGRVGDKYSQYLDFRQQDAHELLRHLLDGMRMEEADVIKKRQPPPQPKRPPIRAQSTGLTPVSTTATTGCRPEGPIEPALSPIKEEEQLHSFVDMIFGGQLASILVCEGCKHISHTYEDFNDLSLSLKPEEKSSKRDRLKHLAQKLIKGGPTPPTSSPPLVPLAILPSTLAETPKLVVSSVSLASPTPVHLHSAPRPAFLTSDTPRAQSVPPQSSLSNTPLKHLVEAAPTDINRRRSDELLRRSTDAEPLTPPGTIPTADIVLSEVPDPTAPTSTASESQMSEKSQSDGLSARIGRRVSRTLGLGGKEKHRDKSKDQGASATEDLHTEDDADKRGREEGRSSGEYKRNNSSKRASVFSLTPSVSRDPSPQPPQPEPSISTKKNTKKSHVDSATKEKHARQKARAKRKTQRAAAQAAYLRSVLRDDPSQTYTLNPLWKLATSSLPNSSSTSVASAASTSNNQLAGQTLWNKLGGAPGIVESLRQFTAVEALDGENSFACKHCWKLANPSLARRKRRKPVDGGSNETPSVDSDGDSSTSSSCHSSASESEDEPLEKSTATLLAPRKRDPHSVPLPASRSISPLPPVAVPPRRGSDMSTEDGNDNTDPGLAEHFSIVDLSSSKASPADRPSTPTFLSTPTQESTSGNFSGLTIPAISTTSPERRTPTFAPISSPQLKPLTTGGLLSPNSSRDELRGINPAHNRSKKHPVPVKGGLSSDGESSISSGESEMDGQEADSMTSFTTGSDGGSGPKPRVQAPPTSALPMVRPPRSQRVILRRALKRYLIATPPPVLVIHLKRFQQVTKGSVTLFGNFKKLDDYVSFPEYLDLSGFIAPRREDFGLKKRQQFGRDGADQQSGATSKEREGGSKQEWWRFGTDSTAVKHEETKVVYRLYAVVVHIGSMLGGHYVAYTALPLAPPADTKFTSSTPTSEMQPAADQPSEPDATKPKSSSPKPTPPEERHWCFVSDTVVRAATLDEVLRAKAYLCFYERVL